MPSRRLLYLLRSPIADSAQSLLPSTAFLDATSSSLVLLEEAVSSSPSFPGQVYILRSPNDGPVASGAGKHISYQDLVVLIAEHDSTIVL